MAHWIRFERQGQIGFGTLEGDAITVHSGDMFDNPQATAEVVPQASVKVLTPSVPTKMIGLWNNFHALAARMKNPEPPEPLYFNKATSAFLAHGETIRRPASYGGNIVYEGELGIVIGKSCSNVTEEEAGDYVFGYTCINDVTAADIISKDPTFAQWTRAKSFDTFGVFGPVIATGLDPDKLVIKTVLNGTERQNYPVSDMILSPLQVVSMVSRDMTLLPGDVIACGTSVGVGPMRGDGDVVEVSIEGIGALRNTLVQKLPFTYAGGAPKPMRVCVVGAGAIGGMLATKLALAGHPVTVIDLGAHLAAIRENGLTLVNEDGSQQTAKVKAVERAADAGPQDLVILAVKAHFLEQVVRDLDTMLEPATMIMTVQNGMPWWYFQRHGGPHDGHKLESLDPTGVLTRGIDAERLIGCVVYPAGHVGAPGVIHHAEGDRFPIGELDGKETARARWVHDVLVSAGFRSRVQPDIRAEIWLKAWGNLSFNPISALTHATMEGICQFAETRQLAADMMGEAQQVAEALGIKFRHTIEKRIQGAESVGAHKTSMLQDVEFGRSLETEALIGSILELAKLTGTPAPSIQAVYACVKLLNKVMLTEGGGVRVNQAA